MNISQLRIDIPASEVRTRFDALRINRQSLFCDIEGAAVKLEEGRIVVSCVVNPALCPRAPVSANFTLDVHPQTHVLTLKLDSVSARIEAIGLFDVDVSEYAKKKIMDAIRGAVCGKKEFTVSNCSVHIYPSMFLLTNKFLSLTSRLNVVEVNTLGITLKFF